MTDNREKSSKPTAESLNTTIKLINPYLDWSLLEKKKRRHEHKS